MIYLVSYDLLKQKNYERIERAIQGYTACRILFSVWLVQTNLSSLELATVLVNALDNDDRIFVSEFTQRTSWRGLMTTDANMQKWIAAATP
jgi:hypothetical protein